jgi:hypothetical protein
MPAVQDISFLPGGQQDIAEFALLCSIGPIQFFEKGPHDSNFRDAQIRFKDSGLVLNSLEVSLDSGIGLKKFHRYN